MHDQRLSVHLGLIVDMLTHIRRYSIRPQKKENSSLDTRWGASHRVLIKHDGHWWNRASSFHRGLSLIAFWNMIKENWVVYGLWSTHASQLEPLTSKMLQMNRCCAINGPDFYTPSWLTCRRFVTCVCSHTHTHTHTAGAFINVDDDGHRNLTFQPLFNYLAKFGPTVTSLVNVVNDVTIGIRTREHFWESKIPASVTNGVIVIHADALSRFGRPTRPDIRSQLKRHQCTIAITGQTFARQSYFYCYTCQMDETSGQGVCVSCAETCHRGHRLSSKSVDATTGFYCDCGNSNHLCQCDRERIFPPSLNIQVAQERGNHRCTFCQKVVDGDRHTLLWHYARYHRWHEDQQHFECDYCGLSIAPTDVATHGLETCVLCKRQFQHFGRGDWGWGDGIFSWGMVREWDGKEQYDEITKKTGPSRRRRVRRIIDFIGHVVGFSCSFERLPMGSVCPSCVSHDSRLVPVYSH